ncbi:ATP-dependent zinc metalloprotease FtsH [Metamycoplasma orale]|uniref:ATP-dependent zinc metalloprotease FtsH n=1 Tax=Metamycoplasma orale TaxID=2121 RepID=A0A448ZX02_METOS|nr:ATP-dependent zinc metalloprotease FtsH [Metamycoplasma orale]VEU55786.1 AAA family ATPase [Metamycoplasma orale]
MPNNNDNKPSTPRRRFNIWWLLIIFFGVIILMISIVTIKHLIDSSRTLESKDIMFYKSVLDEANKTTSSIHIKSITHDPYTNTISTIFSASTKVWYGLNGQTGGSDTDIKEFAFMTNASSQTISSMKLLDFKDTYSNVFKVGQNGIVDGTFNVVGVPTVSLWDKIKSVITTLIPIMISILILYAIFAAYSRTGMMGEGGMLSKKSLAQRVYTDKKFKDIAGNEEVKEEVWELVDYLKNPKKYSGAGARIPKGILLGGPPGTGKTLIAKATAGEANVPFFFISASNFVEMFVGLGAKRVRDMFEEARQNAPAIIFIDELDAVGRSRGAGIGGGNDEREQTLNQLLVEMDGIKENSGILIMAATNRTDVLDPALLRPGRFDRIITVSLPDIKEREEILKLHAKGKRIDPNVKFNLIARRTPGFSGAQLENVINEATLLSVRENTKLITLAQIDEAIDRVMAGPAKKSRAISEKENIAVAYHEAGHAVVGIKIAGGNKVQKITIIPRGQAGGYNLMLPEEEKYNRSKVELMAMITSFMGGRVAEAIIYGKDNVSTGASDDIAKATRIARKMVTEWGMSNLGPIKYEEDTDTPFLGRDYMKNASFSSQTAQEIDIEVRKIILAAELKAHKIITENQDLLELIKDALIINETITAEEIDYIAKYMKLPEEISKDKTELKKEIPKVDFETLFNEVAGQKVVSEDKYKDDLKKQEKELEEKSKSKTTKKSDDNKGNSSTN